MLFYLYWAFFKIGLFTFGGGYAMIPLLEKEVVSTYGWLTLPEMLDVLAVSQVTPGPIAINMATFVGYKVTGFTGALAATLGVITPSVLIVLVIARFYSQFRRLNIVQGIFQGIRPMVVALIGAAGIFIVRSSAIDIPSLVIMAGSFLAIKYARLSPITVILGAGLLGMFIFGFRIIS